MNNINNLTECTKVLPPAIKGFTSADQAFLDKWLAGNYPKLGQYIRDATKITDAFLKLIGAILGKLFSA